MTRGASVRRPSATQRLLNSLLTSSQNISRVGQSYDRYTPSPGLSYDTRRLRCRFDLPLPETLESRADDAIMAGPIALWDVPDTLRGRTWQADRVATLGLVQVDHRCVFGWMAFGVVQHRILPCWSHARDLVDSTGAVSVGGSRRVRDSCGSFVPASTEHLFSYRDFPKALAPLAASPARFGLPVSPQFHTVRRHVEQSRRGTSFGFPLHQSVSGC